MHQSHVGGFNLTGVGARYDNGDSMPAVDVWATRKCDGVSRHDARQEVGPYYDGGLRHMLHITIRRR